MVNIVSYNILNEYHAVKYPTAEGLKPNPDGSKTLVGNWSDRIAGLASNLEKSHFDVVLFQEISHANEEDVRNVLLRGCCPLSWNHNYFTEKVASIGIGMAYNPKTMKLLNETSFKHHFDPAKPVEYRAGIFMDLQSVKTGQVWRVASIHLRGYFAKEPDTVKKERSMEVGLIELQRVVSEVSTNLEGLTDDGKRYDVDHIVVGGDLNEGREVSAFRNSRINFLEGKKFKTDGNNEVTEPSTGRRIDWIFHKEMRATPTVALEPIRIESLTIASDHHMIGTHFRLIRGGAAAPAAPTALAAPAAPAV